MVNTQLELIIHFKKFECLECSKKTMFEIDELDDNHGIFFCSRCCAMNKILSTGDVKK